MYRASREPLVIEDKIAGLQTFTIARALGAKKLKLEDCLIFEENREEVKRGPAGRKLRAPTPEESRRIWSHWVQFAKAHNAAQDEFRRRREEAKQAKARRRAVRHGED